MIFFFLIFKISKGGILRNVDYIYGMIIYTGKETKIMKNIK
jgi:hypothetical protein